MSHCEGLDPAFRKGRTAVLFNGPIRALVIELKYHHGLHVLEDVERIFRRSSHVTELARRATLVPVPLHPTKARRRSFNQAALIAAAIARVAGGRLTRRVDLAAQCEYRDANGVGPAHPLGELEKCLCTRAWRRPNSRSPLHPR